MQREILKTLGWFYIGSGILFNQWSIAKWIVPDGNIESMNYKLTIWILQTALFFLGLLTILLNKKSQFIVNINLMLWSLLIISPLAGEVLIRLAIGLNIHQFKKPHLYADYFSDDDYWKLEQDWSSRYKYASPEYVHPVLGWSQSKVSDANPLGLQKETLERIESPNPKILFYGDSFVKGVADDKYQIPEYLHHKIEGIDVIDLGVGGYGVDQIYLMFEETHKRIPNTVLFIVGIYTGDLDRVVLSLRTSQKPYFELDYAGQIQLKGIPINEDQKEYFDQYILKEKSYLWRFLKNRFRNDDYKRNLKEEINNQLLEKFKSKSEMESTDLIFVIFYSEKELTKRGWRESYLNEILIRKNMPYIDTKKILLKHANNYDREISEFYEPTDGHHNNLGNQVIADGIIEYLVRNGYLTDLNDDA